MDFQSQTTKQAQNENNIKKQINKVTGSNN